MELRKKRSTRMKGNDDVTSTRNSTSAASLTMRTVRYGECQKNHAAGIGGYALDGCREFMPTADDGSDSGLACAACGCHRNFHRRLLETHEVTCHDSDHYSP